MIDSSIYRKLPELLDFLRTPHALEVFEGASRDVAPRDCVPAGIDDEVVFDALCKLIAFGLAVEAGSGRDELLRKPPRLTERGRRLHAAIEQL